MSKNNEDFSAQCWCGNKQLQVFSEDYLHCHLCGTLVVAAMPQEDIAVIQNDDSKDELYSKNYWLEHSIKNLHQGDIYIRSRTDLTDRCPYWLQTLLKYKLPPAKIVDVGCGHGGFTALMQAAGYDAMGLEISPWVVEFAKKNFGIKAVLGTIQAQNFEKKSMDVIVLMDVVEHLQNPLATLEYCVSLLKPDGLIIIQMPNYPREQSLLTLEENNHPFLAHLIKNEHLFLFSKEAITKLFQEKLGIKYLKFEPAVFDHYDMFLVASQQDFMEHTQETVDQYLLSKPNLRFISPILDIREQLLKLQGLYNQADIDRIELQKLYLQADKDRIERLEHLNKLEVDHLKLLQKLDCKTIAVDLTPVLPNGENGGAKILAIELIKELARVASGWKFVILTTRKNHAYLSFLVTKNISLMCVDKFRSIFSDRFRPRIMTFFEIHLWRIYRKLSYKLLKIKTFNWDKYDLLFCPFTATTYAQACAPTVSVVLDLQHRSYPQFFPAEERIHRDHYFAETCSKADYIVTISDFVKKTVIEHAPSNVIGKIKTIHIGLSTRLAYDSTTQKKLLAKLPVEENKYLLYPANYWKHKNHELLFTAFNIYLNKFPNSELKLVCTGTPTKRMDYLQNSVNKMGLSNRIIFAGYVSNEEFSEVVNGCKALIYPSLYEGFGMPLLEAMAHNKPVLCSNHASLPEIAGDAAIYFDPKKIPEIIAAIERLENDESGVQQLIANGKERAQKFSLETMVQQYLTLFHKLIYHEFIGKNSLNGMYADGWLGDVASIRFVKAECDRILELQFHMPPLVPSSKQHIRLMNKNKKIIASYSLNKSADLNIQQRIHADDEYLYILIGPCFSPKKLGINTDERDLSCILTRCKIKYGDYDLDLIARE